MAFVGRHVGDTPGLELVGPICREVAIDQVGRKGCFISSNRRRGALMVTRALQASVLHELSRSVYQHGCPRLTRRCGRETSDKYAQIGRVLANFIGQRVFPGSFKSRAVPPCVVGTSADTEDTLDEH